jgi:circadian clock protein KaiC
MAEIQLLSTGVPNLDTVLGGGLPIYSLNIIAGPPGVGKTIMTQQILFHHVHKHKAAKVLYFTTLSEPPLKVVRYMQHFTFFDVEAFGAQVLYQDIGRLSRESLLPEVLDHILHLVEEHHAELLVIDSFKALHDLSGDAAAMRSLCYDLSMRLASARCTSFLVGEYDRSELVRSAEFVVADGILYLDTADRDTDQRRILQVYKMRGQSTQMTPSSFVITSDGLRILSPNVSFRRQATDLKGTPERLATGISGLDALLLGGIPVGRSVLLSSASGTGKSTLALQFLVHGARQGETGLLVALEESPDLVFQMAAGFGWGLQDYITQGLIRIVFVPQADLRMEELLDRMIQEITVLQPQRVVVDSLSVFLYKMQDTIRQREKVVQLSTLLQQQGATSLLLSNMPTTDSPALSQHVGVEETVVDGTITLFTDRVGFGRRRYLEIRKMRGVPYIPGHHRMDITPQGIEVYYAPPLATPRDSDRPLLFSVVQHTITVPLTFGTSWLVLGEAAAGKSFLATQFAAEGLHQGESVLYVALEEPQSQVRRRFEAFGSHLTEVEHGHRFCLLTPSPDGVLDLEDDRQRMYHYVTQLRELIPPVRVVVDSITSVALRAGRNDFPIIEERMVRALTNRDTSFLLTIHREPLSREDRSILIGLFDMALDLYTPDWGEMQLTGAIGRRVLRVRKARAVAADARPYPYTISTTTGLVVEADYYRLHMAQGI